MATEATSVTLWHQTTAMRPEVFCDGKFSIQSAPKTGAMSLVAKWSVRAR